MKQFPKWIIMLSIIMVFFICLPSIVHAQPNPCTDPDNPCPIDGGLTALLAVGVGYGIKKVRDGRKVQRDKVN